MGDPKTALGEPYIENEPVFSDLFVETEEPEVSSTPSVGLSEKEAKRFGDNDHNDHSVRGSFSHRTSIYANRILIEDLENYLRLEKSRLFSVRYSIYFYFIANLPFSISLFFCAALILIAFLFLAIESKQLWIRCISEISILLFMFFVNWIVFSAERKDQKLGLLNKIWKLVSKFRNHDDPFFDGKLPSKHAYNVLRGEKWIKIPENLLVRGDQILLLPEQPTPCRVRSLKPTGVGGGGVESCSGLERQLPSSQHESIIMERAVKTEPLQRSVIFSFPHGDGKTDAALPCDQDSDETFLLLETPAVLLLQDALRNKVARKLEVSHAVQYTKRICLLVQILTVSLGWIASLIKYLTSESPKQWTELLLLRPAYHAIPLLCLSGAVIFVLCNAVGTAWILSLFETLKLRDQENTSEKSLVTNWSEEGEDDVVDFNSRPYSNNIQVPIIRRLKHLLLQALFRHQNNGLIERMGSVTVVCTAAEAGIITNNAQYVERICIMKGDDPIVLELSRDPSEKQFIKMNFNDLHQKEDCLGVLKALGLNCMLNSHCSFGGYQGPAINPLAIRHFPNFDVSEQDPCLCLLGKEIGFTEGALDQFAPIRSIFQFEKGGVFLDMPSNPPSPPSQYSHHSVSPSSSSSCSSSPLFPSAKEESPPPPSSSPPSSSRHSRRPSVETSIAEGKRAAELRRLLTGTIKRNQLLNQLHRLETLIVFDSHSESAELITKGNLLLVLNNCQKVWDGFAIRELTDRDRLAILDFEDKWSAFKCLAFAYSPLQPELYAQLCSKGLSTEETLREVQKEQIFLGFIAMRQLPKYEMPAVIDGLRKSGYRFVHLSHQDERGAKLFAERLGLETDWNSAMSLKEEEGIEFEPSPSRLPRGVKNVRTHIAEVDNVPLLLPLFYDSTPESVQQMINIFQENGEIVLCMSDLLDGRNMQVFAASDVGIGIEPEAVECSGKAEKSSKLGTTYSRDRFSLSESFSVKLTASPCLVTSKSGMNMLFVVQVLKEASLWKKRIEKALRFYFAASLALNLLILLNYLSFLPTMFVGVELLWLALVIIPILTLGVLFSPLDPELRNSVALKFNSFTKQAYRQFIKSLFFHIVPSVFLLLLDFGLAFGVIWLHHGSAKGAFGFQKHLTGNSYQKSQRAASSLVLFLFVIFIASWAATFLTTFTPFFPRFSRHLRDYIPWLLSALISLILQAFFSVIFFADEIPAVAARGSFVLVTGLLFPVYSWTLDHYLKKPHRKNFLQEQKFLRLDLETKLGMYSPVSPFDGGGAFNI